MTGVGHLERLAGKVEAPSLPKEESHNHRAVPFPNPRLACSQTSLLTLLPVRQQGSAVPFTGNLNSGMLKKKKKKSTNSPWQPSEGWDFGSKIQGRGGVGRRWPRDEEDGERIYSVPSVWDQIAAIFSNPVVMAALCVLPEKVLINSVKAKSPNLCPFLSAFPTHGYVCPERK